MKYYYGVDLGGTQIKFGLFSEKGELLEKWSINTRTEENGKYILSDIAAEIEDKSKNKNIEASSVLGIGLAVPGPVNDNGFVNGCVNLGWKGYIDVAGELSRLTGFRVAAGNDATVAALGEYYNMGDKMGQNAVFMTLGTGVGGGIIVNQKVISGTHGAGGEIGHIKVSAPDAHPCPCGNKGCLEQYASATGIVRLTKEALAASEETSALRSLEKPECKDVLDAAKAGDNLACRVMDTVFGYLGEALAAICCVCDPQSIIIGGGVSKAGQFLIEGVQKHFVQKAFHACRDVDFYLAELGNDAGIYGACSLIKNSD